MEGLFRAPLVDEKQRRDWEGQGEGRLPVRPRARGLRGTADRTTLRAPQKLGWTLLGVRAAPDLVGGNLGRPLSPRGHRDPRGPPCRLCLEGLYK